MKKDELQNQMIDVPARVPARSIGLCTRTHTHTHTHIHTHIHTHTTHTHTHTHVSVAPKTATQTTAHRVDELRIGARPEHERWAGARKKKKTALPSHIGLIAHTGIR